MNQKLINTVKERLSNSECVGLVCDYGMFRYLVKDLEISTRSLIHIDEYKPQKVMATDFDCVIYQERPESKECLAICCKRTLRKDGFILVPERISVGAFPVGIVERMKNY